MKKLLAIMLALVMVLAMVPALAEGEVICHWAITQENKLILSDKVYTGEDLRKPDPANPWSKSQGTITADFNSNSSPYGVTNSKDIITSVEIQGSIAPTTMSRWFYDCKKLEKADLSSIDARNLTDISKLFYNCKSLESVTFPTNMSDAKLEQISSVFSGCENLKALDLSGWNTSNVEDMRNVFKGCKALTSLNVSGWDVSNVKAMDNIFIGCSSLTSLDLSTWNVTLGAQNITTGLSYGATGMFKGCSSLAELKLGKFRIKAGELGPTGDNTTMSTFEDCSALTSLHITEIAPTIPSNVWKPNLKNMFKGCSNLKTLTVDNWDISNITKENQKGMFDDCDACIVLLNVTGTPHANEIPNVTLIPNGGTMADGSLPYVTAGDALPTLVKSGHIFAGWYNNEEFTGDKAEKAEAGKTYYANWTITKVEFQPGEGSGVMPGANLDNGTLTFPECTFTAPANKEFAGWKITKPEANADKLYQKGESVQVVMVEPTPVPDSAGNPTGWAVTVTAQWKDRPQEQQPSGGGNGGGYYHPTTTPVPVIVIPPKTGDMTVWQSILHFLGIK